MPNFFHDPFGHFVLISVGDNSFLLTIFALTGRMRHEAALDRQLRSWQPAGETSCRHDDLH
jgi:hypothetical protein